MAPRVPLKSYYKGAVSSDNEEKGPSLPNEHLGRFLELWTKCKGKEAQSCLVPERFSTWGGTWRVFGLLGITSSWSPLPIPSIYKKSRLVWKKRMLDLTSRTPAADADLEQRLYLHSCICVCSEREKTSKLSTDNLPPPQPNANPVLDLLHWTSVLTPALGALDVWY